VISRSYSGNVKPAMSRYGKAKPPGCTENGHAPSLEYRVGKDAAFENVCATCKKPIRNIGENGQELWVVDWAKLKAEA
jgi:hypothetical protein